MSLNKKILDYLESEWSLASPLDSSEIYWSEEWFNTRKHEYPQISVSPLSTVIRERFKNQPGDLELRHHSNWLVNVWRRVPRGSPGTREVDQVEDMRQEVVGIFKNGFDSGYGGSLTPIRMIIPLDDGVARHEVNVQPRTLRYEITCIATRDV